MWTTFVNFFKICANEVQVEMLFGKYLILSSDGPFLQWSGYIYNFSKEIFMGNIQIWTMGSGGDVVHTAVGRWTKTDYNSSH